MCGICGSFNLNGDPPSMERFNEMISQIRHRGPDSEGQFIELPVSMGFCRLSIIDLETGDQPIISADDQLVVIMNGEIYNYKELRSELLKKGHCFKTKSDAEVLLYLFKDFGMSMLEHINGMFAFALYDRRSCELWLVRDRLGIKPLYYRFDGEVFEFSSDARSLVDKNAAAISRDGFLNYLGFSYTADASIFDGVKKVPAATAIKVSSAGTDFHSYWSLKNFANSPRSLKGSMDKLRGLLEESVKLQLTSDVKKGILLSGGIDSGVLLAVSAQLEQEGMDTFSLQYENKQDDDIYFADELSKKFGSKHHVLSLDKTHAESLIPSVLRRLDEPLADSSLIGTYALSNLAADNGVKVLLSGAGADELFGGYSRYHPNRTRDLVLGAFNLLPSFIKEKISADISIRASNTSVDYVSKISGINYAFLREILYEDAYDDMLRDVSSVFNQSANEARDLTPEYSRMFCDLHGYLPYDILSVTDKGSMASPVEVRVPFLDHRIVEFAFEMPAAYNILGGKPKGMLKTIMKDTLPSSLLCRKKSGFNAPVRNWFNGFDFKKMKESILDEPSGALIGFVDLNKLSGMSDSKFSSTNTAQTMYSLKMFNDWFNINFQGK